MSSLRLDPPDRKYSAFVYGDSSTGKSHFLLNAPGPVLVHDTEGGAYDSGKETVVWEFGSPVPDVTTTDDVVVVRNIRTSVQMYESMRFLRRKDHPFSTTGLDSVHELSERLVREMQRPGEEWDASAPMSEPAWGRVYNHTFDIIKEFRNLSREDGSSKPLHVIVTCAMDDEEMPYRPLTQPAIKKRIRYWFDMVGFTFEATDEEGQEVFGMQLYKNDLAHGKMRIKPIREQGIKQLTNPTFNDIVRIAQQGATNE